MTAAWLWGAVYLAAVATSFVLMWRSWSREFGAEWEGVAWAAFASLLPPVGFGVLLGGRLKRAAKPSRFLAWLDRVTGVRS